MFEAVVMMCLAQAPEVCREVLVPFEGDCALAQAPMIEGVIAVEKVRCIPAAAGYPLKQVAKGIYVFQGVVEDANAQNAGAISNAGFVIGNHSVAVIDALGSRMAGEALLRALRTVTDKPIRHLILTHMHPDHVYGASVFQAAGAKVWGHYKLERALADRAASYVQGVTHLMGQRVFLGSTMPVIDAVVETENVIDLGGRELTLRAHDTAHTGTDVTVFDSLTSTVFAGDLVFDQHTPALDGSLKGWQKLLSSGFEADQIVPGHGEAILPWPTGGQDTLRYLSVLEHDTRDAIERGESMSTAVYHIAEQERQNWDLFDLYNPRNATVAYTELEWE